jgi:glycosyltransferase involved in cell wall biosynthesis
MKSPVSILFPCYLINPWLREALVSIEMSAQRLDAECIVVANNMNHIELTELQELCSEILTINFEIVNAGQTDLVGALNFGINYCKNEYIARFDQDDIMFPERLTLQRDYLDNHTGIALIGGGVEIISESGTHIGFHSYPHDSKSITEELLRGNCFAHPAVMFRKSKVLEVGGYSSTFAHAEDYDLFIRLNQISDSANLHETLIKYRNNVSQVSNRYRSEQVLSTRALILQQYLYRLGVQNFFPIPQRHLDLNEWVGKVINCVQDASDISLTSNQRIQIRVAISQSHFAIARSTGYRGKREWGVVINELRKSLFWSPSHFLRELYRTLKPH